MGRLDRTGSIARLAALPALARSEYEAARSLKTLRTNEMPKPTPSVQLQAERIPDEQIRERAYDIWERHHRPDGFEMQFWLMAKRELMAEREARIEIAPALKEDGSS